MLHQKNTDTTPLKVNEIIHQASELLEQVVTIEGILQPDGKSPRDQKWYIAATPLNEVDTPDAIPVEISENKPDTTTLKHLEATLIDILKHEPFKMGNAAYFVQQYYHQYGFPHPLSVLNQTSAVKAMKQLLLSADEERLLTSFNQLRHLTADSLPEQLNNWRLRDRHPADKYWYLRPGTITGKLIANSDHASGLKLTQITGVVIPVIRKPQLTHTAHLAPGVPDFGRWKDASQPLVTARQIIANPAMYLKKEIRLTGVCAIDVPTQLQEETGTTVRIVPNRLYLDFGSRWDKPISIYIHSGDLARIMNYFFHEDNGMPPRGSDYVRPVDMIEYDSRVADVLITGYLTRSSSKRPVLMLENTKVIASIHENILREWLPDSQHE